MNSMGFSSLAKIIGKSNKAILYDQRGTGKSTMDLIDTNTITLDLMVSDIETIRRHLNIKSWVVLGHSFGGLLAAHYATKFPERIKGLILSSSGGVDIELLSIIDIKSRLTPLQQDSLKYWSNRIAKGDTTYNAKFQRGKNLAPAYLYDTTYITSIAHRMTQANMQINQLVYQNMRNIKFDCSNKLKNFDSPVLIIQGEEDIIPKQIAEKSHMVYKNSELVYIPKCAHYGWLEQPEIYFNTINGFLSSL